MEHPSSEALTSFLEDRLDGAQRAAVAVHLDDCANCQAVVERLVDDDLEEWKPSRLRPAGGVPHGPAYERALEQAAQGPETLVPGGCMRADLIEILEPPTHDDDLGALEHYRVRSVLGHGGMGVVFEAVDPALERTVALKVLRPALADAGARQRFVREAQAAARVRHDHVVTVFAVASPPARPPYLVMEYLPGPTLRALIVAHGRLTPRLAAELCAQVAEGLDAAHSAGLVHRDIKPNNVLLVPAAPSHHDSPGDRSHPRRAEPCFWRAKIADFGLARPVEHSGIHTLDGALCGTPAYLSPEQINDPSIVDGRCDVYSLGVTLYEALTGEVPFRGSTPMVLQQAVSDEPRPPGRMVEGVPRDLETICLKAMEKEPERRYASPRHLADDLRRWLRGEPILARPLGRAERLARWCRRNPRLAALSGAVAALLLCTVVASVSAAVLIARAQRQTVHALADARAQRGLALDSLNDLISRTQNLLEDRPGTLALRQQILAGALKNLQRITRDAEVAKIIDHDTIVAHQRIGDVLWLGGKSDAARVHYERSEAMARTMADADPTSDRAKRDLAWAHDKLGVLDQHALRLDKALEHYRASLRLREEVVGHPSADVEARRERVAAVKRVGDVASLQGNQALARKEYERALELARAIERSAPDDLLVRRDVMNALRKVAWACLGTGDSETAEKHLVEAIALLDTLRALDPDNLTWRQEEAWLSLDLGTLEYERRDYAKAVTRLLTAADAQKILAQADPGQAESQWNVAQAENALTRAYLAQGRYQDAREHAAAAARITAGLADKHPSTTKFGTDASFALVQLAGIAWRLNRWDEVGRSYAQAFERLQALEARGELQSPGMRSLKTLVELLVVVLPLRERAQGSLAFVEEQPRTLAPALLCIRAYDLARAGRFDDAAETADRADDFTPGDPAIAAVFWDTIARSYGLIAAGLSASPALDERGRQQLHHCVTAARKAMAKSAALNPSFGAAAVHEPELRAVR